MRTLTKEQVLRCQRHAHHLDKKLPRKQRLEAVSACGLVNSPPGSWELAMAARVAALTRDDLRCDLIETKDLMQTWSLRGAPTIFPTAEAGTFLSALAAQPDEVPIYAQPLSYTTQALAAQRNELLEALRQACAVLEHKTIVGKAQLDHDLAEAMKPFLPKTVRVHANEPSLVAENQTLLEAAVSYLLRQCALEGRVMMGERQGNQPAFTSPAVWFDHPLDRSAPPRQIVEKFLHCYGPATVQDFARWSGCGLPQAKRLWALTEAERVEIEVEGKRGWMLEADLPLLESLPPESPSIQLLGPHDPFLDLPQHGWILPDKSAQKKVWRTVGSPGVVIQDTQIIGFWNARVQREKTAVQFTLFETLDEEKRFQVQTEMAQLQTFLGRSLGTCRFVE